MSGFVGWIDHRRDLSAQQDVLHVMTETMRNRGSGGKGIWMSRDASLGHCCHHLMSAPEGVKQPFPVNTGQGAVVLVFAGVIYNASELRQELRGHGVVFRTTSDIEVLLQSFLVWGSQFVERLNGMFAFAIWDERVRQLLLGRDRLGLKPLYYFEYPDGLLFASEPKGIMANPVFEARLDFSAIPILLQPRFALPGETPLLGLREVPPAHVACFSETGLSLRRFWRLNSAPHSESFDETARHVRGLMEDIVSRQITRDVSGAAMLSGGVDSTCVAALAAKSLRGMNSSATLDTYCIQFDGDSRHFLSTELRPEIDAPYAAMAADFIGSRHTTVTVTTNDLLNAIPQARRARDLPGWGQFDASMYLLFREMRRNCTVSLTGEAADEIFGGYPYFFKPDQIRRHQFPWLGDGIRLSDYLSSDLKKRINPQADESARYSQLISEVPRLPSEDPWEARMREVQYLSMSGPLAVILDRKDRMSMSLGLEIRIPFCDHRLIEYVWNVPWSMKSHGGVKGLLKAAMADLLPRSTLVRRKSAYPHVQNPEYDESLIHEAHQIVNDARSPIAGMFDASRTNQLIEQIGAHKAGVNGAHILIPIVEMSRWIDEYNVSLR